MIGSPDLLVFTGGEGFGVEATYHQDTPALPNELSIPLEPPCNPWTTAAKFHRDFILIAEFSEQVGPQPVMTIPEDPRVLGSFDLNHFSVRIMSVDYQAAFPAAATAYPGPRINFAEDSRVVMGDSADGAFAYVQHMTLYDLEARGFVRPFCMAYVSSDRRKLMEHFGELSACFTQASDSLKTGNRRAFAAELQRKLQQLEYMRLTQQQGAGLQDAADQPPSAADTDDQPEALERSILNFRDLLRQVTAYPNRKLKQPGFLPYDPADGVGADPHGPPPPAVVYPACFSSSSAARLECRLKSLEELSDAYFLSVTVDQLTDTERRLRGDRSALLSARLIREYCRGLPLTNFLFELRDPEEGEEEEEGEGKGGEQQEAAKEDKGPWASLESFFSCVEELPIKLEAETEGRGSPPARDPEEGAAAEMAGSVSSGDSIEVLGTERSYRTQSAAAEDDHRETAFGKSDLCLRYTPPETACGRRVRAYAVRGNSEDSIEVLSTTDIVPEDLQAITEEEDPEDPRTPYCSLDEEPVLRVEEGWDGGGGPAAVAANRVWDITERAAILQDGRGEPRGDAGDNGTRSAPRAERGPPDGGEAPGGGPRGVRGETGEGRSAGGEAGRGEDVAPGEITARRREEKAPAAAAAPSKSPSCLRAESAAAASDLRVKFASTPPAVDDAWSPPCALTRTPSVDEASESTASSKSPSQARGPDGDRRLDRRRRKRAGLRALRFIQQNSFSQHAVFCLLSGRPLVVIGGDEGSVRKLVSALTLFLPAAGPERAAVLPLLAKPLQLIDLLAWRLIGLHRTSSCTSLAALHSLARYSRYLALLDLDQRTLRCPAYSGSLIGQIANRHSSICRGRTYLLHLESCLTALANRALLYTFHPALRGDRDGTAGGEARLLEQGFCSSEDDLRVMRFLSNLIKQFHAGRGPPILNVSYRQMQTHKHDAAT